MLRMATLVTTRLSHPAPKASATKKKRGKRKRQTRRNEDGRTRLKKADICNVEPVSEEELQKVLASVGSGAYYWDSWDDSDEADSRWTITDLKRRAK